MKIWSKKKSTHFNLENSILLKVDFHGSIGFCYYSPWISLGQKEIEVCLEEIRKRDSFLIALAWKDAFISQKIALSKLPLFKSHSFFSEKLSSFSPEIIKIKLSGDIRRDVEVVKKFSSEFKNLRLDANYKYNHQSFLSFWNNISSSQNQVEYVEDPVSWSPKNYESLIQLGVPVALDQVFNNSLKTLESCEHYVVKPTVQVITNNSYEECIFSHNMNGALSDWQTYCELVTSGDFKKTHGVASHSKFMSERLFTLEGNYVCVNILAIKKMYEYLYSDESWERVV